MTHEEAIAKYLVEGYVLKDLTAEERKRFEDHLFVCPRCLEEVRMAKAMLRMMRQYFESQEGA